MKYKGGKAKVASALAETIAHHWPAAGPWSVIWEPFMGGANMTE